VFWLQPQELHTKCPDLLEEPLSDAALDVSHHVPLDNTQPHGCTLMLRASPGQCYGKGKRKAFRQAMIQICLDCSLVESAKTVCPGKPRGSEQRVLMPAEQSWRKGPRASSSSNMPLFIHLPQHKAPCRAPCQL